MCQRAETIIYTISTNVSPSRDRGDDVLREIAEATGRIPFYPKRIEDVTASFRNIEEELRSQYPLVYRPADLKMDGSFRTIYLPEPSTRVTTSAPRRAISSPPSPEPHLPKLVFGRLLNSVHPRPQMPM